MNPIIPRDAALSKISDKELLSLLSSAPVIARTKVLHELSFRRNKSIDLKAAFFSSIVEEKNRNEIFFGFIKVSWIPVIDVLDSGDKNEIEELKHLLVKEWSFAERKDFYEYVKKDFDIAEILVTGNEESKALFKVIEKIYSFVKNQENWFTQLPKSYSEEFKHERHGLVRFTLTLSSTNESGTVQKFNLTFRITIGNSYTERTVSRGDRAEVVNEIMIFYIDASKIEKDLPDMFMGLLDYPRS